ncbi:carbon dioxide-concentrating mechanism protein [Synechococcus sp. C9]|jgi:carbon dioxide concentrating mechanism protein CcmO|uniref:carbon dioxide-concentrating mechanism protein n=1 Tax=Synechococcus sp. C9 TaxID=102119 RepID=UPI00403FF570
MPASAPTVTQPLTQMNLGASRPAHPYQSMALGLVATQSFPALVGTADMMLKSAGVHLVGYEKTGGGYCTAVVRGDIASVRLAVQAGVETAEAFGQYVSSLVLPRPLANLELVLPISPSMAVLARLGTPDPEGGQAVGLLETRGFPALVGAADAMLKAADVHLVGYDQIGAGLCTVILRGRVADVTIAIDAGMEAASRIGELHAIMVIPRPLEDLVHTLPQTASPLQELQPLQLPLAMTQRVGELVEVVAQEG